MEVDFDRTVETLGLCGGKTVAYPQDLEYGRVDVDGM